jgi:hypothetical protein
LWTRERPVPPYGTLFRSRKTRYMSGQGAVN